jgi:hypothetical protein
MSAPEISLSTRVKKLSAYNCLYCGLPGSLRCCRCKGAYYCGVDHQKLGWKEHKLNCVPRATCSQVSNDRAPRAGNVGIVGHYDWIIDKFVVSHVLSDMSLLPMMRANILADVALVEGAKFVTIAQDGSFLLIVGNCKKTGMGTVDCWSISPGHSSDDCDAVRSWRFSNRWVEPTRTPVLNRSATRTLLQSSLGQRASVDAVTVLDTQTGAVLHNFVAHRSGAPMVSSYDNHFIVITQNSESMVGLLLNCDLTVAMWDINTPSGKDIKATRKMHRISSELVSFHQGLAELTPDNASMFVETHTVACPVRPWIAIGTLQGGIIWDYDMQRLVVSNETWNAHFAKGGLGRFVARMDFGLCCENGHMLLSRVQQMNTGLLCVCLDITADTVLFKVSLGPPTTHFFWIKFNATRKSFVYLRGDDPKLTFVYEIDAGNGALISQSSEPIPSVRYFHIAEGTVILL